MSICILIWHFCFSPTHSYLGNYQRIPETQISRLMENFGPCHPLLKFACFRRLVILEGICRHPYSIATEAKAGCWCRSGVWWGRYWKILGGVSIVMGKGSGKGLRQLASMNSKNWTMNRWNLPKMLGGCWFLQWEKLLGSPAEQVPGNCGHSSCMSGIGSSFFSSLFLAVGIYLCFAGFWMGWNPSRPLM